MRGKEIILKKNILIMGRMMKVKYLEETDIPKKSTF